MKKDDVVYWFKIIATLVVAFAFMMLGILFGKEVVGKFNEKLGDAVAYWLALNFVSVCGISYQINIRGTEWEGKEGHTWKEVFVLIWKWNAFVIVVIIVSEFWEMFKKMIGW